MSLWNITGAADVVPAAASACLVQTRFLSLQYNKDLTKERDTLKLELYKNR